MRARNLRYSADPVDLGAQSDLSGAPESMNIQAVLAVQIGGYARGLPSVSRLRSVIRVSAQRAAARVGQERLSMNSPLSEAKKLAAKALHQHRSVRPRESTTW